MLFLIHGFMLFFVLFMTSTDFEHIIHIVAIPFIQPSLSPFCDILTMNRTNIAFSLPFPALPCPTLPYPTPPSLPYPSLTTLPCPALPCSALPCCHRIINVSSTAHLLGDLESVRAKNDLMLTLPGAYQAWPAYG